MRDVHPIVRAVIERVEQRSSKTRRAYLDRAARAEGEGPHRHAMACSNLAHTLAASDGTQRSILLRPDAPNVGIVTAYNDMLSAHQPLGTYPELIKRALLPLGVSAQVAGGVPAMCDGITQGRAGMELSLLSRDVIAMATAVALAHDAFDGVMCLGVCDKIVPGLLIGALAFGHLPTIFVPAGPMPTGVANTERARTRQLHAEGKATRLQLFAVESGSFHAPGTCTFYGTANSNQMLMEIMGLHLPGASFVNPGDPLRDALTVAAARRMAELVAPGRSRTPLCAIVDERAIVNGIVGLLATGGSTNHTLHLVAIARAAGIVVNWDDFAELSRVVPLLARIYPSGTADVNDFARAGGMAFLIGELLDAGLLDPEVHTVAGHGLDAYRRSPRLADDGPTWEPPGGTADPEVLRPVARPFSETGGLQVLDGNLGRAVVKTSAVTADRWSIDAPALVFADQAALLAAFAAGELDRDFVAVLAHQGPRANGMPELHKIMTPLASLQDRGRRVALVTDGRLSGASGKVLAAIHVTPEASVGGPLARVRSGDRIVVDASAGTLSAIVADEVWRQRTADAPPERERFGLGRELFATLRAHATGAERGAVTFGWDEG